MSILAIDYGDKKVGLAKSDENNKIAVPLTILKNTGLSFLLTELKKVCAAENIDTVVVGVPLSLSSKGKEQFLREVDLNNQQMKKVLSFIDFLKLNINIPVVMEDERLSTKMANGLGRGIRKGGHDDAVAAMLILQSYLDKK